MTVPRAMGELGHFRPKEHSNYAVTTTAAVFNAGTFILPRVKTPGLFIKLQLINIHTKAAFGLRKPTKQQKHASKPPLS